MKQRAKKEQISVRCTLADKRRWEAQAKKADISFAKWAIKKLNN